MKRKVKGKKKVAGSIGLLTAAVCCFGAAAATTVSNSGLYNDGVVRVYAVENQESYVKQWQDSINALEQGNVNSYNDYINYVKNFKIAKNAFAKLNGLGVVAAEEQLVYDSARELVAVDADYSDYVTITLYGLEATGNIKWSDKAEYDKQTDRFSGLSTERQGWLKSYVGEEYDSIIKNADDEFARIESAMGGVINAINDLKYVGKVDSKESLDAVADAIKLVYGVDYEEIADKEVDAMAAYINETTSGATTLAMYDNALALYNAIVTECAEFDAKIVATYEDFTASGKYYTERLVIEALHREYANMGPLQHGDVNDNRQTLITESAKIFELVAKVKDVDTHINVLQNLIREIPAEFDYTDDYSRKVTAARTYYEANIIADLKAVVEASAVDAGIQGYIFLCEAEANLAECKATVDALMAKAFNLQKLFDESSSEFVKEVNEVVADRATLPYQKQKDDFNKDYGELLASMRAKVANINATVTPVIEAIEAIGEVKLSDAGIGARINTARTMYDALQTEIEKNSVTNYNKLVKAEQDLDALTAEANDWKKAVDAIVIDGKITTTNIADINAVESTFNGWVAAGGDKADLANVVKNAGTKYSYDKYDALLSDRNALLNSISELASKMNAISTDLEVISANPTVFTDAVEAAKLAFDALDATVQAEYFTNSTATNNAAYAHYLEAYNLYKNVYELVGKIIELGDPALVTMASYNDIYDYLAEYETLSDDNKAIVTDGGYKTALDNAKATVDALKVLRDAWIADVYALAGEVDKAVWDSELYSVNLDLISGLETRRAALDNTDKGLDEATTDFAKIVEIGNKRVTDINQSIADLVANQPLKSDDIDTLKSIYNVYHTKLHESQQKLVKYDDFEPLYNRYVFAQNFDEAVQALYKDVFENKNFTSNVPVVVGILRSVYVSMNDEMKELITQYSNIQKIEDEYNKFVEEGGKVLNLTDAYKELNEMIKDIEDEDFAAQIKDVADELALLDADLDSAIVKLNKAVADLETANGSITAINKAIEDINTSLQGLTTSVGDIENDLIRIEGKFDGLVKELREDVDGILADISSLKTTDQELLSKLGDLETALDTFKTLTDNRVGDIENDLIDLEDKFDGLVQKLREEVNGLLEDVSSLETMDQELLSKLGDLETALDAFKNLTNNHLDSLDADVASLENDLEALKTAIEEKIAALEKADASLKNEIDSLRKSLTTVTVILSIVSGLALAGAVALFLIKYLKKD